MSDSGIPVEIQLESLSSSSVSRGPVSALLLFESRFLRDAHGSMDLTLKLVPVTKPRAASVNDDDENSHDDEPLLVFPFSQVTSLCTCASDFSHENSEKSSSSSLLRIEMKIEACCGNPSCPIIHGALILRTFSARYLRLSIAATDFTAATNHAGEGDTATLALFSNLLRLRRTVASSTTAGSALSLCPNVAAAGTAPAAAISRQNSIPAMNKSTTSVASTSHSSPPQSRPPTQGHTVVMAHSNSNNTQQRNNPRRSSNQYVYSSSAAAAFPADRPHSAAPSTLRVSRQLEILGAELEALLVGHQMQQQQQQHHINHQQSFDDDFFDLRNRSQPARNENEQGDDDEEDDDDDDDDARTFDSGHVRALGQHLRTNRDYMHPHHYRATSSGSTRPGTATSSNGGGTAATLLSDNEDGTGTVSTMPGNNNNVRYRAGRGLVGSRVVVASDPRSGIHNHHGHHSNSSVTNGLNHNGNNRPTSAPTQPPTAAGMPSWRPSSASAAINLNSRAPRAVTIAADDGATTARRWSQQQQQQNHHRRQHARAGARPNVPVTPPRRRDNSNSHNNTNSNHISSNTDDLRQAAEDWLAANWAALTDIPIVANDDFDGGGAGAEMSAVSEDSDEDEDDEF